jgi:uncharacterized protein DUF6893
MKALKGLVKVVGTAGLLLGGYILMKSLPDLRRYIKISTM